MLSSQYIRENTDRIKSDLALRGVEAPIDEIVKIDKEFRSALTDVEELRAKRKVLSKEISGQLSEVERNERIQVAKDLGEKLATKEEVLRRLENNLKTMLYEVPNIIDPSTPRGSNETDNIVIETVGKKRDFLNKPKPHWELSVDNIGIDLERAAKLSGSRFFILNAGIARLQRGLIQWMLDLHIDEGGFTEFYLPYLLTEESLFASGHLPKFRENLFLDAEDDYFLIPTAEAPFAAMYRNEILSNLEKPLRYVAHTPCFRREKMSAGRDTRGLKRVHQFDKVEMFIFCEPSQSNQELENLLQQAKKIPEKLEIPFRTLELCSADLDFKVSKSFDIEMWAPGSEEWLEVSSVSNCLDFQSRRANIRYRKAVDKKTEFPHTLNGSGLGVPRTLIAIIENYQQSDGSIAVPTVLQKYLHTEIITFENV